jgi:hypothetical protein
LDPRDYFKVTTQVPVTILTSFLTAWKFLPSDNVTIQIRNACRTYLTTAWYKLYSKVDRRAEEENRAENGHKIDRKGR